WLAGTDRQEPVSEWGLARALRTGQGSPPEELEIEAADGTYRSILYHAMPVRDDDGRVLGAVSVDLDITERRQVEERARYLADIVASSLDSIVGLTFDGIVTSWNEGAERLYGYKRAE